MVYDSNGNLLGVPAGPDGEHDIERVRKVRECIGVTLKNLRSSGDAAGSDADVIEQSLGPGACDLSVPSWATVHTAHADPSPETHAEEGNLATEGETLKKQDRQQRMAFHAQHTAEPQQQGMAASPELDIEGFCTSVTSGLLAEKQLLEELEQETLRSFPKVAHMSSGKLQASLLALLCELSKAHDVLELGTFTGYSSLVLAGCQSVKHVLTIERDPLAAAIAGRFFQRSAYADKIVMRQGNASKVLEDLCQSARSRDPPAAFDLVFLDAGKRDYEAQRDLLLKHGLIRVGSLVVADNVLWAGAVPRHCQALAHGDAAAISAPRDRQDKVTRSLYRYVTHTAQDAQWQQLVLPLRDGLSIARRIA